MSGELQTLRYLSPDRDAFWEWKDDGEVIAYRGGGTLAFRAQILPVIQNLSQQPLPPLELILLILAACRDTWPADRQVLESIHLPLANSARPLLKHWWKSVFDALHRVQSMPRQIRTDSASIVALIEIALERRGTNFRPAPPELIKILSQPHWLRIWQLPEPLLMPFGERTQGYSLLTQGLLRVTVDEIVNRKRTGLETLPEAPDELQELLPEELPEVRTVRQLIDELKEDEEYRGLIRVVRTLSAVLTLPRDLSVPELLPQGGVSDITNRGPLDRLLLSELAHDDDTLMTRIALNEALYIRRETPPAHPFRERVLLIDAGIRMWGLPRLCAAAVGLCLASHEAAGETVRVFRSDIDGLQSVDFTTREGLTEHLAALDCLAHPGKLLNEWQNEIEGQTASEGRSDVDRILILGEDVFADSAFRADLRESACAPAFVVTVNREGRVRLVQLTGMGEKLLRELWVDIDSLCGTEERPKESLIDHTANNQLPAFLKLSRMPLRMPYPMTREDLLVPFSEPSDNLVRLLQITRDRRLLLWDEQGRGGRQITDRFPPGQLRWSGWLMNNVTYVHSYCLVMVLQAGQANLVQLRSGSRDAIEIETQDLKLRDPADAVVPDSVFPSHNVLIFRFKNRLIAVYPVTGEILTTQLVPEGLYQFQNEYFIKSGHSWWVASYWNGQIRFDQIISLSTPPFDAARILAILGTEEERVAVLSSGEICWLKDRQRQQIASAGEWLSANVTAISPNRSACLLQSLNKLESLFTLKPVPSYTRQYTTSRDFRWGGPPIQTPSERNLFRNLTRLEFGSHLIVVSKSGTRFVLDSSSGMNTPLQLRELSGGSELLSQKTDPFEEIPAPAVVGYSLRQVQWQDGSRAVLDSRGLLHLISGDRQIPELTLALHDTHISGWCSTGEIWGTEFFLDTGCPDVKVVSVDRIKPILSKFVGRLK